ncbi:MAG: hypothetical protein K6E36_04565 [Oscillospiraceae bacterium]|nr:hypothetical protein [Oscillospiraceae bacterium]
MADAVRQILLLTGLRFRQWRKSPQIRLAFGLGFVAVFLLTNKTVLFAQAHGTVMQIFEPFIWTFGDAKSILLISLCLLLLFADMPNLGAEVPLMLIRTTRRRWMAAQILYLALATVIFTAFLLLSSCILCAQYGYPANKWSETAAILSYSPLGQKIAVPAFVKVLELTYPYRCTLQIFLLMLGYSMTLAGLMFLGNLLRARLGMVLGIAFSGFGLFLSPDTVSEWFHLSVYQSRRANILFGWLSPLNHATYYMHSFGYDNLPRLRESCLIFAAASAVLFLLAFRRSKQYAFCFTGTER